MYMTTPILVQPSIYRFNTIYIMWKQLSLNFQVYGKVILKITSLTFSEQELWKTILCIDHKVRTHTIGLIILLTHLKMTLTKKWRSLTMVTQ